MSELAVENLIETGSIPEGKVSIEEAIANMGKAATLAEWVYAGLRIETRDWSAELRKSSDVQLPKFALLENSAELTGSIMAEAVEQKAANQKHIGTSVGLSSVADNNLDQRLLGVRDAKVMGLDNFHFNLSQDASFSHKAPSEGFASISPSAVKMEASQVIEIVAVSDKSAAEAVVAEPVVAPEPVVFVEPETSVVAVIENPAVETVVAEPVVSEPVVFVEPETSVVAVIENPAVETVVAEPVVSEPVVVAEPEPPVVAVIENPAVETVVAEPVVSEPVMFVELETSVVAVIETPAVEAVVAEPVVAPEPVVFVEPETSVVAVIETPAVEAVVAEPVVSEPVVAAVPEISVSEPMPHAESDLGFGRLYFHDFESSHAKIVIKSDFITNFDDLIAHANLYQDEASAVFELDNGSDFIILTHFALSDVSADMFVFEPANQGSDAAQVFIRENENVAENAVTGDVFNFGLESGRIYVNDFDVTSDKIFIKADLFSSFDEMMSRTTIYQDETSAVFELHDSADMIIMPHFSIENISKDMFVFEADTASKYGSNPDIQLGTNHDDILIFGAGDQMIDPGLGFDVVTGGEGSDTFIFGAHSGHDFIVDFRPGEDHIQISADLAHDFADIMDKAAIYQDGGATQIEFAGGQLITLFETSAKTASAEWFSFS